MFRRLYPPVLKPKMAQTVPEEHIPQNGQFQLIPPAVSGLGICVSCLVLAGWAFNISTLRSVIPSQPQMVPNTAITFILASVSLWVLWREKKYQRASVVAWICGLTVIFIVLLTLGEYLTGADLGF